MDYAIYGDRTHTVLRMTLTLIAHLAHLLKSQRLGDVSYDANRQFQMSPCITAMADGSANAEVRTPKCELRSAANLTF